MNKVAPFFVFFLHIAFVISCGVCLFAINVWPVRGILIVSQLLEAGVELLVTGRGLWICTEMLISNCGSSLLGDLYMAGSIFEFLAWNYLRQHFAVVAAKVKLILVSIYLSHSFHSNIPLLLFCCPEKRYWLMVSFLLDLRDIPINWFTSSFPTGLIECPRAFYSKWHL